MAGPAYPITDGFHHSLPARETRLVVWGDHPVVVGTATTWVQKRGLRVVERARLRQVFLEQEVRLTHTPDDEAHVLSVGKLVGAAVVVFTESSSTQSVVTNLSVGAYGGGGSSTPVMTASVSIRGVDVETGEVLWTGNARYPRIATGGVEDALTKLTCQALATAWGYRPPGDLKIGSESMCALEK